MKWAIISKLSTQFQCEKWVAKRLIMLNESIFALELQKPQPNLNLQK